MLLRILLLLAVSRHQTEGQAIFEKIFEQYSKAYFDDTKPEKFKSVTLDVSKRDYPQWLLKTLNSNPTARSTNKPVYWSELHLGGVECALEASLPSMKGKELYESLPYGLTDTIIIALRDKQTSKVSYRAFWTTTEETQKTDAEVMKKLKKEVSAHLHGLTGELENFYVQKISLEKSGEKAFQRRGAGVRDILKISSIKQIKPASGPHSFQLIEERIDERIIGDDYLGHIAFNPGDGTVSSEPKKIGELLKEMDSVEATGLAVAKSLAIISNKFARIHKKQYGGGMIEAMNHGFTHGAFALLFEVQFDIMSLTEMSGGVGYIDLFLRIKSQYPVIIEFKNPTGSSINTEEAQGEESKKRAENRAVASAKQKLNDAHKQISENGYARIVPYIVGLRSAPSVVALGVAFNQDHRHRIKGSIIGVEKKGQNLFESLVDIVQNNMAEEAAKKTIENSFEWLFYSTPEAKGAQYMHRKFVGFILACKAKGMKIHYYKQQWEVIGSSKEKRDASKELIIFVIDLGPNQPLLKFCFGEYLGEARKSADLEELLKRLEKTDHKVGTGEALRDIYSDRASAMSQPPKNDGDSKKVRVPIQNGDPQMLASYQGRKVISVEISVSLKEKAFAKYHRGTTIRTVDSANIDFISVEMTEITGSADATTLVRQLKGKQNSEVEATLSSIFDNKQPWLADLIEDEKTFQAILDGVVTTQSEYLLLTEQSSGSGRTDLLLVSPDEDESAIIIELKCAEGPEWSVERLDKEYKQVASYAPHIDHFSKAPKAGCFLAVYLKTAAISIQSKLSEESIVGRCTPIAAAQRSKRSIDCWQEAKPQKIAELKHQLESTGAVLDRDGFLRHLLGDSTQKKLDLVKFYKALHNPTVAEQTLSASACANRLPEQCIDEFTMSPTSSQQQKELLKDSSTVSFWRKLKLTGGTLRKLTHYSNLGLMTVDVLGRIEHAVKSNEYGDLAKSLTILGGTSLIPHVGKELYRRRILVELLSTAFLNKFGRRVDVFTLHSMATTLSRVARIQKVPIVIRGVGLIAENTVPLVDAGITIATIVRTFSSHEWEHMETADRSIFVVVESCNLVADFGYVAVTVVGQAELVPVIGLVQFTCNAGGSVATHAVEMHRISQDIELSAFEKYTSWVPFVNHLDVLRRDQQAEQEYKTLFLNNSLLARADGVVYSAPDISYADGRITNLSHPSYARVRIVGSLRESVHYTPSPSRTLVKLGSEAAKLACAPTGPDITDDDKDGKFSIPNDKPESDAGEHNYCEHAVAFINATRLHEKRFRVLYDMPALESAVIEAGEEDINFIMIDKPTIVKRASRRKNVLFLRNDYIPANVVLEPSANNILVLDCFNFSAAQAKGSKFKAIIGSLCPQSITATGLTTHVHTGGPGETNVNMSPSLSPSIHISAFPGNRIDFIAYRHNHISVALFDAPKVAKESDTANPINGTNESSSALGNNWTVDAIAGVDQSTGAIELILPHSSAFDPATLELRIISQEFDDLLGPFLLFTFEYFDQTLHVYRNNTSYAKIYSANRLKRVSVNINFNQRVTLFFESGVNSNNRVAPVFIDIEYEMDDPPLLNSSQWQLTQLFELLTSERAARALSNSRVHVRSKNVEVLVDYRSVFHTGFYMASGNRRAMLKLDGMWNFVYIGKGNCHGMTVILDKDLSFDYEFEIDSKDPIEISPTDDEALLITYVCDANDTKATINLRSFISSGKGRAVLVRTRHEDYTITSDPEEFFANVKASPNEGVRKDRVIRIFEELATCKSRINLSLTDRLFLPDIYAPNDLMALRSGASLLLLERNALGLVCFHDYYTKSVDHTIDIHFANGVRALGEYAAVARDLAHFVAKRREKLLVDLLNYGLLEVVNVREDLDVHLENIEKLLLFYIDCDSIGNVTIAVGNSTTSTELTLLTEGIKISIHGWDDHEDHRPLFVLNHANLLDITSFGMSDVANMTDAVRVLSTSAVEASDE